MIHDHGQPLSGNAPNRRLSRQVLREFARYLVVGGVAFVCDYSVLIALTELGRMNYLLSAVAGFVAGVSVNYLLCRRWVFKGVAVGTGFPFAVFLAIGVAGLGLTELILWIGAGLLGLDYRLIKLVATAVVLIWNFGARKIIVFGGETVEQNP